MTCATQEAVPLLGFGIPVYNRPELLDLALASVVPEAESIGAPIFVSDNACGTTNVEVVERWRRRYGRIIHVINESNIGIDANVDQAIASCPAEYVLVIGDDDVVYRGIGRDLTDILTLCRPAHALVPYIYLDNVHRPITGTAVLPPSEDGKPFRRILVEHGWALGFIGAHVFCRARYLSCREDAIGTYFNHVGKLIAYLDPAELIPVAARSLVGNRADDESTPTWSGDRLNVLFGLEHVMRRFMKGRYDEGEVERAVAQARLNLGYAQPVRLLYWAMLAESSGRGGAYWSSLRSLVPPHVFWTLRAVPSPAARLLLGAFPLLRRVKRGLARRRAESAT